MSNSRGIIIINQQLKRQQSPFVLSQVSHVLQFTTNGKPQVSPPPGRITLSFSGIHLQTQDLGAAYAPLHKDSWVQGSLEQKLVTAKVTKG